MFEYKKIFARAYKLHQTISYVYLTLFFIKMFFLFHLKNALKSFFLINDKRLKQKQPEIVFIKDVQVQMKVEYFSLKDMLIWPNI